jgi:hypothetical protein
LTELMGAVLDGKAHEKNSITWTTANVITGFGKTRIGCSVVA